MTVRFGTIRELASWNSSAIQLGMDVLEIPEEVGDCGWRLFADAEVVGIVGVGFDAGGGELKLDEAVFEVPDIGGAIAGRFFFEGLVAVGVEGEGGDAGG